MGSILDRRKEELIQKRAASIERNASRKIWSEGHGRLDSAEKRRGAPERAIMARLLNGKSTATL